MQHGSVFEGQGIQVAVCCFLGGEKLEKIIADVQLGSLLIVSHYHF